MEDLTIEELWVEYEAWKRYHTPPAPPETAADAWMAAVARGDVDPNDRDAQRQFAAAWEATHASTEEWEAVDAPPPPEEG